MTRLLKLCAATLLTLIITISAFAGQMDGGFVQPTPSQPALARTGEIQTGAPAAAPNRMGLGAPITSLNTWEVISNILRAMFQLF